MKKMIVADEEPIFGMANLYPKRTGLPVLIWVDNLGYARNVKHNIPRLKVQNVKGDRAVDDSFSVSISKDPEVLAGENKLSKKDWEEVRSFIIENYDIFIDHWNQAIDEDEMKELLYRK